MIQHRMSSSLKIVAFVAIVLGILSCLLYISDFNDRNLGLMIGMGLLVGGLQILVFGAIAPLMQQREDQSAG
jgi:vacuolar-type H+-ATPase subunit I/STV1